MTNGFLVCSLFLGFAFLMTAQAADAQESEPAQENETPSLHIGDRLSDEQVAKFAKLALDGLNRQFPNKPSNVMVGPESVQSPQEMHPVFYGCFDWHSSVHGHWMLVRLLKQYPDAPVAKKIREALNEQLTAEKLQAEADYFFEDHNKHFERMYGWAWYFRLVTECHNWDDPDVGRWRRNLAPLEKILVTRAGDYLPKLKYPIRTGVHPNTAFALGLALDYAEAVGNQEFKQLIQNRSREYFVADKNYPLYLEPSGEDFFSAGLLEADLMRRVLQPDDFKSWFKNFLPDLAGGESGIEPAIVTDLNDGRLVHLVGVNLSRAWCLSGIASQFPEDSDVRTHLDAVAQKNLDEGLRYVFSGAYEGEHWLATFAIYTLDGVGLPAVPPTAP